MEDTWKRKSSLPSLEMPLYTDVSSNSMEDGREICERCLELIGRWVGVEGQGADEQLLASGEGVDLHRGLRVSAFLFADILCHSRVLPLFDDNFLSVSHIDALPGGLAVEPHAVNGVPLASGPASRRRSPSASHRLRSLSHCRQRPAPDLQIRPSSS